MTTTLVDQIRRPTFRESGLNPRLEDYREILFLHLIYFKLNFVVVVVFFFTHCE